VVVGARVIVASHGDLARELRVAHRGPFGGR
jgi:hypothetical protein